MRRACIVCGAPSERSRCPRHPKRDEWHTAQYQANRTLVLARDTDCWICGHPPRAGDPMEPDHVLAVADGGDSTVTNMRAAHRSCNRARGAIHA